MGVVFKTHIEMDYQCDICGYWELERIHSSKSEAIKQLRSEGWVIGKLVKCNDCSGKIERKV